MSDSVNEVDRIRSNNISDSTRRMYSNAQKKMIEWMKKEASGDSDDLPMLFNQDENLLQKLTLAFPSLFGINED